MPARLKHLNPSPPDHSRIVRAEINRRREDIDVSEPANIEERAKHRHEELVSGNTAANDQRLDFFIGVGYLLLEGFETDDGSRCEMFEADAH